MTGNEYRRLASNMRASAEFIHDPYEKRTLLLIAQRYDILAAHAAERETGNDGHLEKSA